MRTHPTYDVLIAGAGIAGMLSAFVLNQKGYRCLLIDATAAGSGSIAESTGILQYETDIPLSVADNPLQIAEAFRDCRDAIIFLEKIASELKSFFARVPGLCLAFDDVQMNDLCNEHQVMNKYEFISTLLSPESLLQQFALYARGAMQTGSSAQVDGLQLVRLMLQRYMLSGGKYREGVKLEAYSESASGITALCRESTGAEITIEAGKLILATGYSTEFLPPMDFSVQYTYSCEIIYAGPAFTPFNCWDCNEPYFYLRTDGSGRIVLGGLDTNVQETDGLAERKLRDYFHKISGISHFTTANFKVSKFISTPDGLPVIGPFGSSGNVWLACPFGGNGIVFSAVAAELFSKRMIQERFEFPERYLFRRLQH